MESQRRPLHKPFGGRPGELERRAHRKAQTREQIRFTAQTMFADRGFDAVTVADIAAAAGVSVQTVFNHFATKEELFFDGRVDWVNGPAEAVLTRHPDVPPLTALREHLVAAAAKAVRSEATPRGRTYVAAITASPALSAHERELVHAAEIGLAAALGDPWQGQSGATPPVSRAEAASLVAATSLAAVRALVVACRTATVDDLAAADIGAVVDRVMRGLEDTIGAGHAGCRGGRHRVAEDAGRGLPCEPSTIRLPLSTIPVPPPAASDSPRLL